MRDMEERLRKMHERADELKKRRTGIENGILGTVSAILGICLIFVLSQVQCLEHGIRSGQNTGSSLLSDSVGGYVLIAVAAFLIGVIVTVLIYKTRKRRK